MKDFIDRTVSCGTDPVPPFKNKKGALVTVAAENGFELQNDLLSRWLRRYEAQIIGHIELYAWQSARSTRGCVLLLGQQEVSR
jgi:hypothetical protein